MLNEALDQFSLVGIMHWYVDVLRREYNPVLRKTSEIEAEV